MSNEQLLADLLAEQPATGRRARKRASSGGSGGGMGGVLLAVLVFGLFLAARQAGFGMSLKGASAAPTAVSAPAPTQATRGGGNSASRGQTTSGVQRSAPAAQPTQAPLVVVMPTPDVNWGDLQGGGSGAWGEELPAAPAYEEMPDNWQAPMAPEYVPPQEGEWHPPMQAVPTGGCQPPMACATEGGPPPAVQEEPLVLAPEQPWKGECRPPMVCAKNE